MRKIGVNMCYMYVLTDNNGNLHTFKNIYVNNEEKIRRKMKEKRKEKRFLWNLYGLNKRSFTKLIFVSTFTTRSIFFRFCYIFHHLDNVHCKIIDILNRIFLANILEKYSIYVILIVLSTFNSKQMKLVICSFQNKWKVVNL